MHAFRNGNKYTTHKHERARSRQGPFYCAAPSEKDIVMQTLYIIPHFLRCFVRSEIMINCRSYIAYCVRAAEMWNNKRYDPVQIIRYIIIQFA